MPPQQHPHSSYRPSRLFVVIDSADGSAATTNSNTSHGMSVTHRDAPQTGSPTEARDSDTARERDGYVAHSLVDPLTPSKPTGTGSFAKPVSNATSNARSTAPPMFGKHVLPLKADHLRSLAFKPVMVKSSSWGGAGSGDSAKVPRQPHGSQHGSRHHHWSIDLLIAAFALCVLLPAAFHIAMQSRGTASSSPTGRWTAFGVPAPSVSDSTSRQSGSMDAASSFSDLLDADVTAKASASTVEGRAAGAPREPACVDDASSCNNRLVRRHGSAGSGLCIAIPSMPRPNPSRPDQSLSFHASQLLRALDSKRAKAPLLERDIRVIVHSSGCNLPPLPFNASDGESLREAARQLAVEAYATEQDATHLLMAIADMRQKNRLAEEHTRNLQAVAGELELQVTVVDHSREQPGCEFVSDHAALLRQGLEGMNSYAGEDAWKLWIWRSKLALDFSHVTRACLDIRPQYVLMLQDDTLPADLYDIGIERFMYRDLRFKSDWSLLSLYHPETFHWHYSHGAEYSFPCCAQAVLFNVSQLPALLGKVEESYWMEPMDFQIRDFLKEPGRKAFVHVPSLFQHVGDVRSGGSVKGVRHVDTQFYEKIVTRPYLTEPRSGLLAKRDGTGIGEKHMEPLYPDEENKLHPRHREGEEGKTSEVEEVRAEERERFMQLMAEKSKQLDRRIAGLTRKALKPGLALSSLASQP